MKSGNFKVSNIRMHNKFTLDIVWNSWASHKKKVGSKEHTAAVEQRCSQLDAWAHDPKLQLAGEEWMESAEMRHVETSHSSMTIRKAV